MKPYIMDISAKWREKY